MRADDSPLKAPKTEPRPSQELSLPCISTSSVLLGAQAVFTSSTATVFPPTLRDRGFGIQLDDHIEMHDDVKIEMVDAIKLGVPHHGKVVHPPPLAEYLLYLVVSIKDYETFLGDLEEKFQRIILPKFGPRKAAFWYWRQTAGFLGYVIWRHLRNFGIGAALLKLARYLYRRFVP